MFAYSRNLIGFCSETTMHCIYSNTILIGSSSTQLIYNFNMRHSLTLRNHFSIITNKFQLVTKKPSRQLHVHHRKHSITKKIKPVYIKVKITFSHVSRVKCNLFFSYNFEHMKLCH